MRILHITPTFFSEQSIVGGGERYVDNVCSAILAVSGNEVQCDILSFGSHATRIARRDFSNLIVHQGHPDNILSCAGTELDTILAGYDVVNIHQCLTKFGVFMGARARALGACVIGTDHGGGEIPQLEAYPAIANIYHAFHAQSEFARAAFRQLKPASHVILGPVDETLFSCNTDRHDLREIVTLGRILPHKGYEHAIAALPEGARLTIIGRNYDSHYYEFLQNAAKGKEVIFSMALGDSDMMKTMRQAGLLLHTGVHIGYQSQYYAKPELLSLAPLEAMCSGTPAIVSRAGALPELANVKGCRSYETTAELRELLKCHMAGELFLSSPVEIRGSAIERYGLQQFGRAYLSLVNNLAGRR